jgi:hypothetical protein
MQVAGKISAALEQAKQYQQDHNTVVRLFVDEQDVFHIYDDLESAPEKGMRQVAEVRRDGVV